MAKIIVKAFAFWKLQEKSEVSGAREVSGHKINTRTPTTHTL